ncbi:MAG: AraC family transcriptional regulator, partial [Sphingobacteriales bacterium]
FLPRQQRLECHHQAGNRIFGIKFRVSPIVLQKAVNFSEYRESIYPLAYLIDKEVLQQVKAAPDFETRVLIISAYYQRIIDQHAGTQAPVTIVTDLLKQCEEKRNFSASISDLAAERGISARTLQRYFLATTSITGKEALQILRIRSAVELRSKHPGQFRIQDYGYYDQSHFQKHLRQFLGPYARSV